MPTSRPAKDVKVDPETGLARFKDFARQVLSVPKAKVDARAARERAERQRQRGKKPRDAR